MIKRNKLYLIAVAVLAVAFLLTLSVSCSPEMGDNAGNGTEPSDVTNDSSQPADTPTPAVEEDELTFLSKRGYISETGCPTIVGEVENVGNFSMENILLTASFYCSKGKQVGAEEDIPAITSGYTEIEILAPGETSPFKIALSREELSRLPNFDINKVEKFKVEVSDYNSTDEQLYKSLEISQSTGELNATGHYTVVGTVKNIGNETAKQIKVVGTFYDNQERIIEVIPTYLQEPLLPGDEAQFEITVPDETISQRIETYYIQAVGYEERI